MLLFKEAFQKRYGSVPNAAAAAKITGYCDQPQRLIHSFKNDTFSNVSLLVDLLSMGVVVPSIGTIVLLRRVTGAGWSG